ncbi:hypothetical protein ACWEKT_39415 [Nocardia takedensis]
MEEIEWQEALPGGVRCVHDVLGVDLASALNGTPVTVHLPGPPVTAQALPLTQPTAVLANFDLDTVAWGFRPEGSSTMVVVNRLGFTAAVSDSQLVGDEMNDWTLNFLSWLDILTGQHLTPVGFRPLQQARNRTCLMARVDGELHHSAVFRPFPKVYPLTQLDATEEMLRHCCVLAGTRTTVPLPWMLLRDARALHRVDQMRRAAIECGSAAEMAIKQLLIQRSAPPSKKGRTLGPLSESLKDDGYPLASDFEAAFLAVRNREVHMKTGWGAVSETESRRMLEIAVDLVQDAFPLPNGIKRLW